MSSSYITESLSKDEMVHKVYNLHWTARIPFAACIILAVPSLGLTLLIAIYEWYKVRSIEFGSTNKRVIYKRGIISRQTDEMKISSIETVEITQSVLGRIFGYGDVEITGQGISNVVFKGIDDPMSVKKSIENIPSW